MKYERLGNSGLIVSRIALGMMTYGTPKWRDWILDEDQSRPIIKKAVEMGINFFDTANMYSRGMSEEVTGRTLKEFTKRDEIVLATKAYFPVSSNLHNTHGLSRKHLFHAVDDSLKRLQTDYIDLYQIHRWDDNTPIEETMEALHDIVRSGKVRYIGASSMWAWQFSKAQYTATLNGWTRFISMQNHYNLVYREEEREMNPLCLDQNVGLIPWSPLARGFLSGNRSKDKEMGTARAKSDDIAHRYYYQEDDFEIVIHLCQVAENRGVKPAQIALAWLLQQPGVVAPIIGASKIDYLNDAKQALDIHLTEEECHALESHYLPHPVKGINPLG